MTWGEAAWTAADLLPNYIVTDPLGSIHGRYMTEDAALLRREYLTAEGVECWVVPVDDTEAEDDCPTFARPIVNRDPGDESDHIEGDPLDGTDYDGQQPEEAS